MADNTAQTGTDTIATDDVTTLNGGASSGVKVQRVKPSYGDDGTARDVSAAFPLPTSTPSATVSGTITAANANLVTGTATANSSVVLAIPDNHASWTVVLGGTFSSTTTLAFQCSLDGVTWFYTNGRPNLAQLGANETLSAVSTDVTGGAAPSGNNPSLWKGTAGGVKYVRVTCATYTAADAVTVRIDSSAGTGGTFQLGPLPAGTSTIGVVNPDTLTTGQTVGALNAAATVTLNGQPTITFAVTGTYVGTLSFEAQYPDGTWFSQNAYATGDGVSLNSTGGTNVFFRAINYGYRAFRLRMSSYTSGAATVTFNTSYAPAGAPLPAVQANGDTFSDARSGIVVMGRTAGSGATAIAKQLIADADGNLVVAQRPADLAVTATATAGTAVTLTLPAVAGKNHYITALTIQRYAAAALTGAAAPTVVTSTNLPGSMAWTFDTAGAIGTSAIQSYTFPDPLKSSAVNTATTIVCPTLASAIWRVTAAYYAA